MESVSIVIKRAISSVCNINSVPICFWMFVEESAESSVFIKIFEPLNFNIQKCVVHDIIKCVQMCLIKCFTSFYVGHQSNFIWWIIRKVKTGTSTCNKPVSTKGFCHRNAFVEQVKQFLECFFLHLIAALDHGRGQRKIFFPKHIQQLSCYIVCACDHRKQHGLSKGNLLFPCKVRWGIAQELISSG